MTQFYICLQSLFLAVWIWAKLAAYKRLSSDMGMSIFFSSSVEAGIIIIHHLN